MKNLKNLILESPLGYRLWSKPLSSPKNEAISALLLKIDNKKARILDIGCGPGTNSHLFEAYDYLGLDLNPEYIESAKKKFPLLSFQVADAANLKIENGKFDIILINSLMHHLSDNECKSLMQGVLPILSEDSVIIVQEPLIPNKNQKLMELMMKQDRGDYFRSIEGWNDVFKFSGFKVKSEDTYEIKIFGMVGWKMYSVLLCQTEN
jgi:SAM-dependent methyltransferase